MSKLNHPYSPGSEPLPLDSPRREVAVIPASVRPSYFSGGSGSGVEGPDSADSGGGLLDYWRILRFHKLTIILTSLAGLVIGFAISIPMKPVYRARTSIEVLNLNEDFMNMKQANPVTTTDNSYETSEELTQVKLLESDALLDRVLNKLDPGAEAVRKPAMATSGWRSWLHLRKKQELTERRKLLNQLADSLNVRNTARTRIIEVTADSTDPQMASDFVNTLVQEFVQQSLEARFATTHRTSDWLIREIDGARDNLKKSEDALQTYARNSGLIFTDENTNVATEKLQQVQQQLSAATSDRIARQARFELAKNSPPDTVADVLSDPDLKDVGSKLTDLHRQVANLSAIYNPDYGQLKRAQAELAVTESAFERKRADILKRIENDYREAVSKESLLAASYDAQVREVTGQDEKAIQYNILKREVDSGRQLYDTMLQETKQSSIASALRASNVRVVDAADLPDKPFSPNFKLNAVFGFFAGIFVSIAAVIIRERADRTLQQPGDIRISADITELGTVPRIAMRGIYGRASVSGSATGLKGNRQLALTAPANGNLVELISWRQKPGLIAEGFRSILTSILFAGDRGSQVLVFTSAHAGDGKTTVVSNLGIAAAEIRRKVLIIDADLRRPRMHDIFRVSNDRGLSDILRNQLSEENVADIIQPTEIPNLYVLCAGKATDTAVHLLYSSNFAPVLARFKKEYDMVLLDTPPMSQMTDARVAGRLADAVVLVARAGDTTRDAILAARERLGEDCIPVLGSVLNDWNPKKSTGSYFREYRQHSYKKYSSSDSQPTAV